MLQTFRAIEQFASRIERAYLRHRPQWRQLALDARIWSDAVGVLLEAHRQDPRAPIDPELFVVCVASGSNMDPWVELTHPSAGKRYLSRVRAIIRSLRNELTREVRRAEKGISQGIAVEDILLTSSRSMTPLSRYIVAVRLDRDDLATGFREQAQAQHRSCPLYREAAAGLISRESYPFDSKQDFVPKSRNSFSLN